MLNINSNDSQIASSYPYNNLANTKIITAIEAYKVFSSKIALS